MINEMMFIILIIFIILIMVLRYIDALCKSSFIQEYELI
jgi:hypothetical protein